MTPQRMIAASQITRMAVKRIFISHDARIGKAFRAVTLVVSSLIDWELPVSDELNSIQLPTNGTFVLSFIPLHFGGWLAVEAAHAAPCQAVEAAHAAPCQAVVAEVVDEELVVVVFGVQEFGQDGVCAKIGVLTIQKIVIIAREKNFFMMENNLFM